MLSFNQLNALINASLTAFPISTVLAPPPRSLEESGFLTTHTTRLITYLVLISSPPASFESRTLSTAFSTAVDSLLSPKEYLSIIATDRKVAIGFAIPVAL
jgi:hypothetical protein